MHGIWDDVDAEINEDRDGQEAANDVDNLVLDLKLVIIMSRRKWRFEVRGVDGIGREEGL